MATESRISFLEGALTQTSERLRDHTERFSALALDIQSVREEIAALRAEMNSNVATLRAENREDHAATRRESRWIGGIVVTAIVVAVIANLVAQGF
ncbi:MAG: hypothetical protein F4W95_02640 [Chloroflexi bacterium]|nr:hypothetical protein [Chloroflexota bacterium]MYD47364.1 hypothetical protein [Chloroflexota bacterium]